LEFNSQYCRRLDKSRNLFSAPAARLPSMLRRFTDHPASVNETYLQHLGMAFGFGGRMLVGSLACFVHGLFPWLCLSRGSDTIRSLHHRMVTHRIVRPRQADTRMIAAE
jgi:hypothetical protein